MFVHLLHNLSTQWNIMNRCVNCVPLSFQQALYVTMHEMDRDKVNQSTHLSPVYTIQLVVKPFVMPVVQPGLTTG